MDALGYTVAAYFLLAMFRPDLLGRWIAKVKIGIGKEMSD